MAPDDEVRAQLIDLLRQLVDIPSVSRDEGAITEVLRDLLPPTLSIVHDDDTVVVAMPTTRRPDAPLVVLAGHTDTVPIVDNVPGRIEGNVLHGRGTCDMKAGLAVMATVAEHWTTNSPIDLGLCYFGREELSSDDNPLPEMLSKCRPIQEADLVVVLEPTSNKLEVGCQGNIDLKLTFRGEAAHSARPWMGKNAAHHAIAALSQLTDLEPHDVEIQGLVYREVVNVVDFRSGIAHNVIPPIAEVDLNIRYAPGRDPRQVETEWIRRFSSLAEVTVVGNAAPGAVVASHPLVGRLLEAGARGLAPKQAWTNVADFSAAGIAAINFGAGDPALAHKDDESVDLDFLFENFKTLKTFMESELA